MRTIQQLPSLRAAFQKQVVDEKKSVTRQQFYETLGSGFLGSLGAAVFEIKQVKNQFKGSLGEWGVSLLLKSLPDNWVMFNNALIPTTNLGTLTEIDHLIIGSGGIFLVEVKTWSGSFSRTLAEIICDRIKSFPATFLLLYAIRASPRSASSRVQTSVWGQTSYLRGDG